MKESASFSGKEIENVSLDFSQLREEGLKYIQELSGDIWTDYNSHDPGVTILEQLVYALTDVAYRTSLPIEDLLTTKENILFARKNGFFAPSQILSSHPVTIEDTRKLIIDKFFDKIQNVWMIPTENFGIEEKLNGVNQIEILPKIKLLKSLEEPKEDFLKEVNLFLQENRNIAEWFKEAILLKPKPISINFDIYLSDKVDFHATIANLFLKLFEFMYSPIQFSSLDEMKDLGSGMQEIFSGPKLKNGFIKIFSDKQRLKEINTHEVQKLLTKVEGIDKCVVNSFLVDKKKNDCIKTNPGEFFHLLNDDNSNNLSDNRFDSIYENMNVFVNNKEFKVFDKQKINHLAIELWSKKYRRYPIGDSQNKLFLRNFKGKWHELKKYYSVQRHFPIIYGIGEEGLSENEPDERKAKAHQLKAFLMLFEQHLANQLSQLGSLNEFFNIQFNERLKNTYFTQWMDSVPGIEELAVKDIPAMESYLESEDIFFDRKNRIYGHLLARFGEEFNEIPWKISRHVHLIRNYKEYQHTVLKQKSKLIQRLYRLSYYSTRGEYLIPEQTSQNNQKFKRIPSGLEEIIVAKTGIRREVKNSFIHDLKIPFKGFENIDEKTIFRETLKLENYKIQNSDSKSDELQVEFRKEKDNWIKITGNLDNPIKDISTLTNFFIKLNLDSEGIYIVDHILLKDFLKGSKYGFSYFDESGNPLLHTGEQDFWSEENRNEIFRPIELKKENFFVEKGKWMIKHENWKPIEFTIENNEFNKLKPDLEKDIYIYKNGKLEKNSDDTTNNKSEKELDDEKLTIEKLTKIFDDVYSKTNNLNCPIKMALFPNFYSFENGFWTIKYGENTLASFKILAEDLDKINNILLKQAFFFNDGKWRIKYDEKMLGVYKKIKREDLQALITILSEQNYFFQERKWKLKEKVSTDELQHLGENERQQYLEKHNKKRSLFDDENVQEFVSYHDNNLEILTRTFETAYHKIKNIIQLLNNPEDNGRLRFNEVEEIRFRHTEDPMTKNFGQRHLVFQQKLSDDINIQGNAKIVNEDFFNLKVSVLLPDWPARFQEAQFKDYVEELIHERIPNHISNDIYWINILQMKSFKEKYNNWKNLKANSNNSENPSKDLMQAAFDVYMEIQELQKNKK